LQSDATDLDEEPNDERHNNRKVTKHKHGGTIDNEPMKPLFIMPQ
jgi:hypothetical protein